MNVRLIIPMCPTPLEAIPRTYLERIARIAGGFTVSHGNGGWIDPQGLLILEPVWIVETSIDHQGFQKVVAKKIHDLRQVAVKVCNDLNQDCVFLSFDGEAHYVLKDGSDMTPT